MTRALLLVLDSFGIGASEDAGHFGDTGANTLGHISQWCAQGKANQGRQGPLHLPNLARLGLVQAATLSCGSAPLGLVSNPKPVGSYGFAIERSCGKDTPSGHWEMAGVPMLEDWGYFTNKTDSFPPQLLETLIERCHLPGILGNCHASGTNILKQLGEEHLATQKPILYTSVDSVLQIACHEEIFGLERLYHLCEVARELVDAYQIGRVIARPFLGTHSNEFIRTGNRRDLATPPPTDTLLDRLVAEDYQVIGIGKIADIFAHQGISKTLKATGLDALFDTTLEQLNKATANQLIFTNFVDFDSSYGHRRDVAGYAKALEDFDARLPELLAALQPQDLLILTADHGCDPTWPGTDHTRENVPVLVYGKTLKAINLGARSTFADIGQTLADYFNLAPLNYGESFLPQLRR